MKKLKMKSTKSITFEEGCNKYLEYCRQKDLRQGTINHYRQSYVQFFKFFDPNTPIEEIDEEAYKSYVLHLKETLDNDGFIEIKDRCSYIKKPVCEHSQTGF